MSCDSLSVLADKRGQDRYDMNMEALRRRKQRLEERGWVSRALTERDYLTAPRIRHFSLQPSHTVVSQSSDNHNDRNM